MYYFSILRKIGKSDGYSVVLSIKPSNATGKIIYSNYKANMRGKKRLCMEVFVGAVSNVYANILGS